MDKTVPPAAAVLLDFIGDTEVGKRADAYDVIFGFNQGKLSKPITSMTIAEVLRDGPSWAQRFGSSASGRYQIMAGRNHTLAGLAKELRLRDGQKYDADLQDRLGYHLLIRRGYERFMAGTLSTREFAKKLAQEWASFPVLAETQGAHRRVSRGQSYYAGDGVNKALVKPEAVEALLAKVKVMKPGTTPTPDGGKGEPVPVRESWIVKLLTALLKYLKGA